MIDIRFQSLVLFVAISSSSSDLIYYLVLFLLLLLSGDVELNPGPMIDDQPSCISFAQYFKALIDWKPFALCLPGITQSDVSIVTTKKVPLFRMVTLCKKWIEVNPTASWRDVINALKQCKENELARTIEGRVTEQPSVNDNFKNTSPDKRIEPIEGKNSINENSIVLEKEKSSTDIDSNGDTRSTSGANSNNESISTAEEENGSTHSSNHDTARGDHPNEILRTHYYELVHAISEPNLCNITVTLHTKELIPQQTKEEMLVLGLEASLNPKQYLIDICHVLINQQHHALKDIATSILHQLGQPIPKNVSLHTVLLSPVDGILNTRVTMNDLICKGTRLANDSLGSSGEIPRLGSTIKYNVKGYLDNELKWKWVCTLEDTCTGLKTEGPPMQSHDDAIKHCLKRI